MEAPPCSEHPQRAARRRCNSCGRWLCDDCWCFDVDGMPWCAPCVALLRDSKDRLPLSFVLTAILLAAGFAAFAARREVIGRGWAVALVALVALFAIGAARSMRGESSLLSRQIAEVRNGKPTRPRRKFGRVARQALARAVPSWSSKATVLVILSGFGLAAALVPAALKLPRYAEAEVVLVAWLGILWTALSVLLYRGARLGDDHLLHVRVPEFGKQRRWAPETEAAVHAGGELVGCLPFEGCAVFWAVFAFAALAIGASWLLVELLFPAFFLLAYTVLRGALARVTNDAHDCAGSISRALAWGFVWSAAYTAPLALFVALLHLFARP